jgi:hypothetical protein
MAVRRLSLYAAVAAACVVSFSLALQAHAQSNVSPDRAAGRMIDSLFEPNAPESLIPANQPQQPPRRGVKRPSLKAKLVRNSKAKNGAPSYALVDRYGGILRYVEPVDTVKLEPYVGKVVGVRHDTGDTLLASQLIFPPLTARSAVASRPNGSVRQAAFQEPIPAGEPEETTLLEPTPADAPEPTPATEGETYSFDEGEVIEMGEGPIQGEEVYMGEGAPMYEDGFGPPCADCESGTCSLHMSPGFQAGMRPAGVRSRAYAHGEYLLWWIDGMDVPPLVTTSTDPDDGGVLPNPGLDDNQSTVILYGADPILEDPRSGFRVLLGVWLDECNKQAIEGDYLFTGELEETFFASGEDGDPIISRPFFDFFPPGPPANLPPQENAEEVSSEDLDGSVTVNSTSSFQGAGIRLRHNLCRSGCPDIGCGSCVDCGMGVDCGLGVGCGAGVGCGSCVGGGDYRYVDFISGFRWYSLDESLSVTEDLIVDVEAPGDTSFNGTRIVVMDSFETDNDFYGGELGFDWGIERGRYSVNLLSKIAIGNNSQRVSINGSTQTFPPGVDPPPAAEEGGLLALSSNIGDYERDRFSMIPELNVNVGYKLTQRLKLRVGYTILYWTNVLRPGDQINRQINSTLLAGETPSLPPLSPLFEFNETNALVQGLNVGAEFCW